MAILSGTFQTIARSFYQLWRLANIIRESEIIYSARVTKHGIPPETTFCETFPDLARVLPASQTIVSIQNSITSLDEGRIARLPRTCVTLASIIFN